MSKIKSFVRQFTAFVKGDDTTVLGEKVFRQADSALKTQISSLGGDIINLEDKVSDALEGQAHARINNGTPITDRNTYVENLLKAKNKVTEAEEALQIHKEKIEFLKGELSTLSVEVEDEA